MNNTRKWLPYSLFVIAVTTFFIYYLFPSEKVKNYITFNLNKSYPGINIAIDHVKPAFPPGLRLYNVNFYMHDLLFRSEQIKIAPGLLSLFRSKVIFFFKGRAYTGILEGKGEFTKKRPKVMIEGKLSGMQIKEISAVKDFTGRNISGVLDGKFTYWNENESGDNLKAELIISDGELELLTPVFKLRSVPFSRIAADLVMKNRKLQVKRCIIKGDQMNGSFSGTITLKNNPGQSYLKLSGTIKPHPTFIEKLGKDLPANLLPKKIFGKDGVRIRVYGTIGKPRFFLN